MQVIAMCGHYNVSAEVNRAYWHPITARICCAAMIS